jgi:hypothetical protein
MLVGFRDFGPSCAEDRVNVNVVSHLSKSGDSADVHSLTGTITVLMEWENKFDILNLLTPKWSKSSEYN